MTIQDYIRVKITERGINQTKLAEKAGFKGQSNVSALLKKGKNIETDSLFAMLDALNCELMIRDRDTGEERIVRQY